MSLHAPTINENGSGSLHRAWPPFPLTGKGRDRGARVPIQRITPTFILPRRGEGMNALYRPPHKNRFTARRGPDRIFQEGAKNTTVESKVGSQRWDDGVKR